MTNDTPKYTQEEIDRVLEEEAQKDLHIEGLNNRNKGFVNQIRALQTIVAEKDAEIERLKTGTIKVSEIDLRWENKTLRSTLENIDDKLVLMEDTAKGSWGDVISDLRRMIHQAHKEGK